MATCGVNIMNQAFLTKWSVFANLFAGTITDKLTAPFQDIEIGLQERARSLYQLVSS